MIKPSQRNFYKFKFNSAKLNIVECREVYTRKVESD